MDSPFELTHHPAAAQDFRESKTWFAKIDADLADLFETDFKDVLRGLASGKLKGHLLAAKESIRWVKLARFSHKVFFAPDGATRLLILGLISGRRHPTRIRLMLGSRRRKA